MVFLLFLLFSLFVDRGLDRREEGGKEGRGMSR